MDPDVTLEDFRRALRDWKHAKTHAARNAAHQEARQSADALNVWIAGGGFLPRAWVT